ncbi:unnamed protein product [Acanthoscelides obtectus]|nr:unnamed protein product [Acanthoscelides obtectus]CAK1665028.1 hypothetical protein AOBTE_LOCUS24621 [Acanthoscelides obtectus]
MVMMLSTGQGGGGGSTDGPHREMAVDVPDTFVARNKTPPRYPPPKAALQVGYDRLLGVTFGDDTQERAIDVPDNFVERKKTPPKYPSPKVVKSGVNGAPPTLPATPTPSLPTANDSSVGVAKPVPPPRDHLKIEKDGRLVNRAPAPQLPARLNSGSGAVPQTPVAVTPPVAHQEPTKEQLDSIKKYQIIQVRSKLLSTLLKHFVYIS